MGKAVGSVKLGNLYSGGKVRKRREWRGLRDTLYDYWRWLKIMKRPHQTHTHPLLSGEFPTP